MYIQHSLTELAAFQGLSRDTCWAVQHLSVQFLRARVVPGTQWESHACCSKFLLLDFHFCLFCLRGNVPLPCDRNPSKLIYKPSGGDQGLHSDSPAEHIEPQAVPKPGAPVHISSSWLMFSLLPRMFLLLLL